MRGAWLQVVAFESFGTIEVKDPSGGRSTSYSLAEAEIDDGRALGFPDKEHYADAAIPEPSARR